MNPTSGDFDSLADLFDDLAIAAADASSRIASRCPPACGAALDAGCGTGRTCAELSKCCDSVVGLDLSIEMLRRASELRRARAFGNLHFVRGDILRMPFGAESFGFVHSHTALHHVADLPAALSEIARVTAVGGEVLLVDIVEITALLSPTWVVRLNAIVRFGLEVFRYPGSDAIRRLRRALDGRWLEHVANDRYHSMGALKLACEATLPGAEFRTFRAELGLVTYIEVSWTKLR